MATLSPAGGESSPKTRSRYSLAWLRPLGEQSLFIGSRLLWALCILFVIAYVAFAGLEMARGTQPLEALVIGWQSLMQWLQGVLHGIWGVPIPSRWAHDRVAVTEVLPRIVMRSLVLLAATMLIAFAIGLPLGYLAARHRNSPLATFTLLLSILGRVTALIFCRPACCRWRL